MLLAPAGSGQTAYALPAPNSQGAGAERLPPTPMGLEPFQALRRTEGVLGGAGAALLAGGQLDDLANGDRPAQQSSSICHRLQSAGPWEKYAPASLREAAATASQILQQSSARKTRLTRAHTRERRLSDSSATG